MNVTKNPANETAISEENRDALMYFSMLMPSEQTAMLEKIKSLAGV